MIARCSQPEISWWGWRNTDDEYLVTSIAKACHMDTGAKGTATVRQRGEAPDSCDSDFGKSAVCGSVDVIMLQHSLKLVGLEYSFVPLYNLKYWISIITFLQSTLELNYSSSNSMKTVLWSI